MPTPHDHDDHRIDIHRVHQALYQSQVSSVNGYYNPQLSQISYIVFILRQMYETWTGVGNFANLIPPSSSQAAYL